MMFHVVRASDAEKGPYTELARGVSGADQPLTIEIRHKDGGPRDLQAHVQGLGVPGQHRAFPLGRLRHTADQPAPVAREGSADRADARRDRSRPRMAVGRSCRRHVPEPDPRRHGDDGACPHQSRARADGAPKCDRRQTPTAAQVALGARGDDRNEQQARGRRPGPARRRPVQSARRPVQWLGHTYNRQRQVARLPEDPRMLELVGFSGTVPFSSSIPAQETNTKTGDDFRRQVDAERTADSKWTAERPRPSTSPEHSGAMSSGEREDARGAVTCSGSCSASPADRRRSRTSPRPSAAGGTAGRRCAPGPR